MPICGIRIWINLLSKLTKVFRIQHFHTPSLNTKECNSITPCKNSRYANARQANGSDINLLYSTPSCYLKSLHDAGITWPTKDDDFFPYASDPHAYWTGYFTSRPTLKRYERVGNNFLQVCKQLTSLAPNLYPELLPHLGFMRETMGVMQHHDAVTGTEKQKVAFDYARRLSVGMRTCSANARAVLNRLTQGDSPPELELN